MVKERDRLRARSDTGQLYRFMAAEHARLDELLAQASACVGAIDTEAYEEFRKVLLRHISIEEKILLPAAQRRRGGQSLPLAEKLRMDHGALAALMMLRRRYPPLRRCGRCSTCTIRSKRRRVVSTNNAKS